MNGGGLYRGARFEKESVTEKIVGAAKRVVKGSGKQTVQVRDSWLGYGIWDHLSSLGQNQ